MVETPPKEDPLPNNNEEEKEEKEAEAPFAENNDFLELESSQAS